MLKLLLVDDHELFRAGIKLLLSELAEDVSFFEASNCEQALTLAAVNRLDIVLLDFHLPGTEGLQALRALREKTESAIIVVLSGIEDPTTIRLVIDEGAAGFIPKASTQPVMLAALRLIMAGGIYLPPNALHGIRTSSATAALQSDQAFGQLTGRQVDTLRLAIQGKANKVIARELDVSEATVKAHLSASFRALGVKNRTEAVFAAAKLGLRV